MYGENILKLTKEDKKKKFNLKDIIEKMNNYYEEEHKFERKNDEMKRILDIDDEILRWQVLLDYKIPYFSFNNKYYLCFENEEYIEVEKEQIENNSKFYFTTKKAIKDGLMKPIILYKYVHKVGDRYFSFYDENYEYKKGEIQRPRYECDWLYLRKYEELNGSSYAFNSQRALLKCEVSFSDLSTINLRGDILAKKIKVLDIKDVSDNEHIEDDSLPF